MKEFTTEYEEVTYDAEREARITALVEKGATREDAVYETEPYVSFKIDGRELKAYNPSDGQLAFMLASLGRGQSQESRFASIINIMMESLRGDDKDYLEGRLLTGDPKRRLPIRQIEGIFEHLTEEWFARPTQPASGSAPSPLPAGQN